MKKLLASAFILTLAFSAFGKDSDNVAKTRKEVEAALPNYSVSIVTGPSAFHYYQALCGKSMLYKMEGALNQIKYVDIAADKHYDLDPETKTGTVFNYTLPLSFDGNIANLLFVSDFYKDKMVKTGSEKIIGRDATVYTAKLDPKNKKEEIKFWIDNEYGFILKSVQTGSRNKTMEVTAFKAGGVTEKDCAFDLKDYKLTQGGGD